MNSQRQIPEWQQAIIDKCYHPTGVWEKFPESEYETSVPARFEKIVARFPDRLAIVDDQQSLTYAELNAAANRVAHGLLERLGTDPEPVAHLFEHSAEAVIALLGVIKAGKFYVPLDIRWPVERLRQAYTVLDGKLLLTDAPNQALAISVTDSPVAVVTIAQWDGCSTADPLILIGPDTYFYIVFTSGSTDAPKGVIDVHRNVLRYAGLFINSPHICPEDRIPLFPRLSFSGSKRPMWGTLLSGSSLFIYDIYRKGIAGLPEWINQHKLTIFDSTPSVFRTLPEFMCDSGLFSTVRLINLGGDAVLPEDIRIYRELFPDTTILRNGLGATEAKSSAELLCDKATLEKGEIPSVGWPFSDIEFLIVDEEGQPLPPGNPGQMVVHTRFVSPGYWRDPALTLQKFRPDPERPGLVYYFTGDLGRIEEDGQIYHLGRVDSQAKVRGQLVDFGEIERALLAVDGITEAVVGLYGNEPQDQHLFAWFVYKGVEPRPTTSFLRQKLTEQLPSQSIPSRFYLTDRLPLNSNGKIDRTAIPAPGTKRPHLDNEYSAPRTPLEEIVVAIWTDILGLDKIGIHDPFLDLGGHSLQAMRIAARVQDEFGVEIPLAELFAAATVAEMAVVVTAMLLENSNSAEKVL